MPELTSTILWVGITFLISGCVKGIAGMGLPTVAMGLLGLVMAPVEAATLLVIPALVTNLWQLAAGPQLMNMLRRFSLMIAGILIGVPFGLGLLTVESSTMPAAILGAVLGLYGIFGLLSPRFSLSPAVERRWSPVVGLLTGILTGATGVATVPSAPFLASLRLEKEELIQALGITFSVATMTLAAGLGLSGYLLPSGVAGSLLALLPTLIGVLIGQRIRYRLHPQIFRRCFFTLLVMLGAYMLARSFSGW